METDPNRDGAAGASGPHDAAVVRHLFLNQIQTMTSLVGLFGRRMPPGDGRDAFADLRARFDAVTFGPADSAQPDAEGRYEVDLADLGRRVARHLDPDFRHRVTVEGTPVVVTPRRASVLAQILAELVIDLARHGFVGHEAGSAELAIAEGAGGAVSIRVVQTGPAGATPRRAPSDLGAAIADSLVRSLEGTIVRAPSGLLSTLVSIPGERRRR